jgi:hypothetical protein
MCWNARASAVSVVAQAVIFADDLVSFDRAHAERHSPVIADIPCSGERAVRQPIYDDTLVEEGCGIGLVGHLMRKGDRIPERGQCSPVGL